MTRIKPSADLRARFFVALMVCAWCSVAHGSESQPLWPQQATPEGLISLHSKEFANSADGKTPRNMGDDALLAQSLSGLAAQAVNEGRGDELVYIDLWDNRSYHRWRQLLLKRTQVEDRGYVALWDLIAKYQEREIIAGYILCDTIGPDADESINVATSLAGILRGVIISQRQEAKAKQLGLPLLLDARGKTEAWCFANYADRFDRQRVLVQSTEKPNCRAIAIAHRIFTTSGKRKLVESVYQWLEAPGLVFGWNAHSDEGESVRAISGWGHMLCPSDWAMNLPALSIGAGEIQWPKFEQTHARSSLTKSAERQVAFILTDGDNLQWMLGNFAWNKSYWASPFVEQVPFGFSLPLGELMEVAPDAYLHLQGTKAKQTTPVVMPGYVFVDHLGVNLPKGRRKELLRWYGGRIENTLQRSGTESILLICDKLDSSRTQQAWKTLVASSPSLTAVYVMKYDPYEAGGGRIWDVERSSGSTVPFISASYTLWSKIDRPGAGTPSEIANLINIESTEQSKATQWVAVHAWSGFRVSDESEHADYGSLGSYSGVEAASRCAEQLSSQLKVVRPTVMTTRDKPKSKSNLAVQGESPQ